VSGTVSTAFDRLAEPVKRWIWKQGWTELRDVQERAIPAVLDGGDVVLAARTASGKTEAVFLPLISRILSDVDEAKPGFAAVYVSPLKALINDQFRRLESLLELCRLPLHRWHGDVSPGERQRARDRPSGILLITPESLEATLVRRGRDAVRLFGRAEAVVVDELHAFIGTERGRQLQSILKRIEMATGRDRIDRIGLSATLGDMTLAAEELRPGGGEAVKVIESREGEQEVLLQVRGYVQPSAGEGAPDGQAPAATGADEQIAEHLFKVLRGKKNLLFGGSRRSVEIFTDRLRELSDGARLPNEFFAHHGNLARTERETVEERLRDDPRPTTAVTTSTLELGIDIGEVDGVAQIGPGWSVASLRQRLGRSGRRAGKPAVLRIYVTEPELEPGLHPADRLRLSLVQAIATIELLLSKWCEPPRGSGLHLATLLQQTLAIVCQFGALQPDAAWRLLCDRGPFRSVDRQLFSDVLRAMARPEAALIEMAPDRSLMLGPAGEKIAASHEFYAVFVTPEEFRIVAEGKTLGTLPVDKTLVPGQTIIFNGRRWRIMTIDARGRFIEVQPTKAALPPKFGGDFSGLHDRIPETMKKILGSTDTPAFLDAAARELLEQGRHAFFGTGLDRTSLVEAGSDCIVLPWVGSIKLETFALALMLRGLDASPVAHAIEVRKCTASDLIGIIREIAASSPPAAELLAQKAAKLYRAKYDQFLTPELLQKALVVERIDAPSVPGVARRILEPAA
jgi:ATP-dependent helicase Lhr and Lhr-like helicase